jgi:hypothetical protein
MTDIGVVVFSVSILYSVCYVVVYRTANGDIVCVYFLMFLMKGKAGKYEAVVAENDDTLLNILFL